MDKHTCPKCSGRMEFHNWINTSTETINFAATIGNNTGIWYCYGCGRVYLVNGKRRFNVSDMKTEEKLQLFTADAEEALKLYGSMTSFT